MPHSRLGNLLAIGLWLAAAAVGLAEPEPGRKCRPAATLARGLLDGEVDWRGLRLVSRYQLDEEALLDDGRLRATVEARLEGKALRDLRDLHPSALCISLVLDVEGELPVAHHRRLELDDLAGAESWSYGVTVDLPEAAAQLLMILGEPRSGVWGAAISDEAGEPIRPGTGADLLSGQQDAWVQVERASEDRQPRTSSSTEATVVRLVPPRNQPVSGATRFDALVSSTAVAKIVFELDGQVVATRKRSRLLERPFVARIELASPPRVQTLRAIAHDEHDREIGSDTLRVNEIDAPLRVRIRELAGDPAAGFVEVAAEVTVPADARLDRIELYRNQTLVARFDQAPIRHRVPTPDATPEDYIRVAAFLADGSSIDDVVLLADPASVEEVEVNLVELHVVATDAEGQPVDDLGPEDFTIIHRGEPQPTQSFAYADDVTLVLGVVIDSSGSMQLVMHDTRKAAAKFLGSTVLPQDRAFLVDFDLQPRLLHPTTSDLPRLLRDLAKLTAEGSTALYDAIVFSMLQFEREEGRKALVVLSDGDDHESRFGPKYCVDLAQRAGVPVYIIGLGALDTLRRTYSKKELRKVTEETGGRLYFVDSFDELDAAYAQINAELRSQYSLSFYADSDLDADELRDVTVELGRPGLTARTVVGSGRSAL
ncbi:MAG: VWA domain-containing protein [bacterium]|nr:VWA domain-containing protein [bacterium]